jgi:histidinol-phosphate/aromatic aminotransferase/cobyric acid decarboxylase-like protein
MAEFAADGAAGHVISHLPSPRIAARMRDIEPFRVMDILARARMLEEQGRTIVHMEVGEPDFPTPQPICDAGIAALKKGELHYTPAPGLFELREAIAGNYRRLHGIEVPPSRIMVTTGSSGALLLALGVLVNPGDEVLLADPLPVQPQLCALGRRRSCKHCRRPRQSLPVDARALVQHWGLGRRSDRRNPANRPAPWSLPQTSG